MAVVEAMPVLSSTTCVFDRGNLSVKCITVDPSKSITPKKNELPKQLLLVTPTLPGTYPVIVFVHGFCLSFHSYTQLFHHISSHGFILVAPQCCGSGCKQVECVAAVTDWLCTGLQTVLADHNLQVQPDLLKLGLSGHSKGGLISFALALGHAETSLKFSALIGIDPVAGCSPSCQTKPRILTYVPRSFDLGIPVSVIGTGLGDEPKEGCIMSKPCAPDGVNHTEFFTECKPPCYYFLAKEYGHLDMLNDNAVSACVCASGDGPKCLMRKCVGGIVVAFMKGYLEGQTSALEAIVRDPTLAPTKLDPVIFVEK